MQGKEDRQRAQEAKFAMDSEDSFRREAAAIRDMAAWAASQASLDESGTDDLIKAFTQAHIAGGKKAVERHISDNFPAGPTRDELFARLA